MQIRQKGLKSLQDGILTLFAKKVQILHHKMAQDTIRRLKMIIEVGTGAAYRYRFFEKMRARRDLNKNLFESKARGLAFYCFSD